MLRRVGWVASLVVLLLGAGMTPAAAATWGPAVTLVPMVDSNGGADATIGVDGTVRGFTGGGEADPRGIRPAGVVEFFRYRTGVAPFHEPTPYRGLVLAAAWDGSGSTYVLFEENWQLKIGKRVEGSNAYAAPTTLTTTGARWVGPAGTYIAEFQADLVAHAGTWWAVWAEHVGSASGFDSDLFQARTLLGRQSRTRITDTAGASDSSPSLGYAASNGGTGRVTMVWVKAKADSSDLQIATSVGQSWASKPLATLGQLNSQPDVLVYAGVTYVTWSRDSHIVVASNESGLFRSLTFSRTGGPARIGVSGDRLLVTWTSASTSGGSPAVYCAQRLGGVWGTGYYLAPSPSYAVAALGQGGLARAVFRSRTDLVLRAQS